MKNMSVGKKIMFAFAIVIALIGVILTITIITSNTRNNDLEQVDIMSSLLVEMNNFLDDFSSARVDIRTVFTSINYSEELTSARNYLKSAEDRLDEMQAFSDKLEGLDYSDLIKNLKSMLNQVTTSLNSVADIDGQLNQTIADMRISGDTMTTVSTDMFNTSSAYSLDRVRNGDSDALSYMNDVLLPVQEANAAIDVLRILAQPLMISQDTSVMAEFEKDYGSITTILTAVRNNAKTDVVRQGANNVMAAADDYHTKATEVVRLSGQSDINVAAARAIFDELAVIVYDSVDGLSAELTKTIEANITTSTSVMLTQIIITIAALAIAVAVAIYLTRIITKPLALILSVADQVGNTGNMHFSDEFKNGFKEMGTAKDELGRTIASFATMMDSLIDTADTLETVASGDLTAKVTKLGENDTMGVALANMVDNLNMMFSEINGATSQVSIGSKQIADGAQALAAGSTEQAASVEELSSSIAEVAQQTRTNAEMATRASALSGEIRQNAEKGSEQMNNMMVAVQEINNASQNISKVIKAIDDIAFQTNILALNAAVEAARAGQHGKGFAVVAEEVRNLASKSADAAKETGEMIENSIQKAELGVKIAADTSESLNQIVSGINQSTELVSTIAENSTQQNYAIEQINIGVDQVSMVVQQNSATAEESAASSEEMNGQADLLAGLVSRFKLRNQNFIDTPAKPAAYLANNDYEAPMAPPATGDYGKY